MRIGTEICTGEAGSTWAACGSSAGASWPSCFILAKIARSAGAVGRRPSRYSVEVMTELCDDTNSGTATTSFTPRATRRSSAACSDARDAMPNATSVGWIPLASLATASTRSFHDGAPPCAISSTPVDAGGVCAAANVAATPPPGRQHQSPPSHLHSPARVVRT